MLSFHCITFPVAEFPGTEDFQPATHGGSDILARAHLLQGMLIFHFVERPRKLSDPFEMKCVLLTQAPFPWD